MKRLLAFFLILMFLAGVSIAESSPDQTFTADEQAYDVYLDVSYVHNQSVRYLSEMERLWDLANDLDSVSDADKLWFQAGLVANFGNNDAETLSRLYAYQHLATVKYGYSQIPELYPLFEALLSAGGRKTTDIIWAGLALDIEAQYIVSPDEMKAHMDDAKEGIRDIMSTDRSYPYLQDLQNYYKEASYLLDYISDFKDNYLGLKEMLDTQKKNQSSYTIDFEFIFDPANFDYVMEVRAAEEKEKAKAIYDRAFALENSGDYAGAINQYWQCYYYEDSANRIRACHSANKMLDIEQKYQKACSALQEEKYWLAINMFNEIETYKDSSSQILYCAEQLKKNSYVVETEKTDISTNEYRYDDNGRLISMYTIYTDGATAITTYEYNDNGVLEKGIRVLEDKAVSSEKQTTIITFNAHGDILSAGSTMHEYTYGERGEILSHRYGRGSNFSFGYYYTYTYEYAFDIPIKRIAYDNGKEAFQTVYHYDEFGNLIQEETLYYSSGNIENTTYTYKKIGQ